MVDRKGRGQVFPCNNSLTKYHSWGMHLAPLLIE
jgi:hypothetical protein